MLDRKPGIGINPAMSEKPSPSWSGFRSSAESGDVRAVANPVTNSLRINVPADDEQRMAVAAVFISREEFLHGQWDVAILNTVAHLALAADEGLIYCLDSDGTTASTEWYLDQLDACHVSLAGILEPMEPFVEAVDKFQLLSVIDEGFKSDIEETFATASLEDDEATSFQGSFEELYSEEIDRATGRKLPESGAYVNPYYVHALSDIATSYGSAQQSPTDAEGDDPVSAQGRTIAEVVARATLDVPHPIEPLGSTGPDAFEPLMTPDGLPDPISLAELLDERYPITPDEFSTYLGGYPKPGSASEVESGTADDTDWEIDMEYTFVDAQEDWVARSFINVRKQLNRLASDEDIELLTLEADDVDLATIEAEDLRQELVARVHGQTSGTMRDYPTALLDIPQRAEIPQQDENIMSAEGEPLPKVLLESFEQHGSFGAVVYHLTEDDTGFELNWHATQDSFDPDGYPHVPDGITEYGVLWRHFHFYERLREHLQANLKRYRDALELALEDAFDNRDALEKAVIRIEEQQEFEDPSPGASNKAVKSGATFQSKSYADRARDSSEGAKIRSFLSSQSVAVLSDLAAQEGVLPEVDPVDSDCPLCQLYAGTCGTGEECDFTAELETFNENQVEFVRYLSS